MTVYERAELLHAAADLIEADAERIARDLALEQGKPWRSEATEEVEETVGNFRMAAEDVKRLDTSVIPSERRGKMVFTFRKPNGVFAVITPWNFPIMIPSELVAPALATGNAVILKPSEYTPPGRAAARGRLPGRIGEPGVRHPRGGRGAGHPPGCGRDRVRRVAHHR
jgi:succinate-semialdehyde dehydrogenase/glutarate-semialdehyde dehydrogenase